MPPTLIPSSTVPWERRVLAFQLLVLSVLCVVSVALTIRLVVDKHVGLDGWSDGTRDGNDMASMRSFYDAGFSLFDNFTRFYYAHPDQWLLFVAFVHSMDMSALLGCIWHSVTSRSLVFQARALFVSVTTVVASLATAIPPPQYGDMPHTTLMRAGLYVDILTALRVVLCVTMAGLLPTVDAMYFRVHDCTTVVARVCSRVVIVFYFVLSTSALLMSRTVYTSSVLTAIMLALLGCALAPAWADRIRICKRYRALSDAIQRATPVGVAPQASVQAT
jgi:hypothetical protein